VATPVKFRAPDGWTLLILLVIFGGSLTQTSSSLWRGILVAIMVAAVLYDLVAVLVVRRRRGTK